MFDIEKYAGCLDRLAECAPELKQICWEEWWSKNESLNKTGRRSRSVFVSTLKKLVEFGRQYGFHELNSALNKCKRPEQCQLAYVKAILRNSANAGKKQKGIKNEEIGIYAEAERKFHERRQQRLGK